MAECDLLNPCDVGHHLARNRTIRAQRLSKLELVVSEYGDSADSFLKKYRLTKITNQSRVSAGRYKLTLKNTHVQK